MVPPGTEIEWRIVITNRSTQDKVLCSIEMPHQRQRNFSLRSPVPSPKNPIKVGPGGTHTQGAPQHRDRLSARVHCPARSGFTKPQKKGVASRFRDC